MVVQNRDYEGTAEDFFYRRTCFARPCIRIFAVSDRLLLHMRLNLRWVRHNSAARFVSLEVTDSTYESIYLVAFILADAVRYNVPRICAALLCRALR